MRGIILRNDGDQLIVQATPSEVQKFASQQQVMVQSYTMSAGAAFEMTSGGQGGSLKAWSTVQPGTQLWQRMLGGDSTIYFKQVAVVRSMHVTNQPIETTSFDGGGFVTYRHGVVRCDIECIGID